MDFDYVNEILFVHRDKEGRPSFLNEKEKAAIPRGKQVKTTEEVQLEQIRRALWLSGMSREQIDKRIAEIKAESESLLAKIFTDPRKKKAEN